MSVAFALRNCDVDSAVARPTGSTDLVNAYGERDARTILGTSVSIPQQF
ncbi:MAG: hypothetical protein M3Z32_12510 [Acidobacteriota bacterium]|nr:hypothetical protein [Acidobacteriota bacterium]